LAENLREEGYATFHAGKWHLGGAPFSLPEHHGFDHNLGGDDHGAPGNYFHPFKGSWRVPTTKLRASKQAFEGGEKGDFLTDLLAEGTVKLIRENGKKKPFFLYFPFYAVHTPLQGKKEKIERYKQVPKEERQGHPTYAAMVESVDDAVGKVLGAIRELGMEKDTLVLFTSDNGGFAGATNHAPLRANKGSPYEGGIRVPLIITGAGVERKGVTCDVPATSSDLYPTILEMAGLPMKPQQHLDGRSLAGALTGKGALKIKPIFWHYPHYNQHPQSAPHSVIRSGSWKLMEFLETGKVELYDLAKDLSESKDLSKTKPEVTKELLARLHTWKKEVQAEPMLPNPLVQGTK
jgi:arylsulfatase A-like enzyme